MLEEVKWGEFRLGDLFEIEKTRSFNKDSLTVGDEYDYVTRTSINQGVLQTTGYVNDENINPAGTWSLGLLQMDFFYRQKEWYAGQFVRKISAKIELSKYTKTFFTSVLNSISPYFLTFAVRFVDEKFENYIIQLPILDDGSLNFSFMEKFIAELEATHLAELDAYLSVTGLKDYELTEEERQALKYFENKEIKWEDFRIGDLFTRIKTNKLPYKAKELPQEETGIYNLPCLTSSFQNQGLNYFAPRDGATILKNVISIPSNSDVYRAYYQSRDFTVLSDAYAIKFQKSNEITSKKYLFLVTAINKKTNLPIYSYKNKLGGWNVVKDKYIKLPIKDQEEIDYEFMEIFISAIKKLAIKDVVKFSNKNIETTREIINK